MRTTHEFHVYSQVNMKTAGSLLVSKEKLLVKEKIIWSCLVSHHQSKARVVKGKLYVTNKRLIFCARYLDQLFEGECWNIPINQVRQIKIQTIHEDIFIRGKEDKLKLVMDHNHEELFTVKNLKFVIKKLDTTLKKLNNRYGNV